MQTVKAFDSQISKEAAGGFLAIPRAFVRSFWHLLRLKEVAFLIALIDLADGRWAMPLALAQIARLAHLSSGAAREVVAQLERAGLVQREALPHAAGVYRWSLARESEALAVAQKLAHRPRLKVKARPAQFDLPIGVEPPSTPPPPPSPRPRLALVPPPLLPPLSSPPGPAAGCQPVAPGNPQATDPPPQIPSVPEAPKTEPCPPPCPSEPPPSWSSAPPSAPPALPVLPPMLPPVGPETPTALGLTLGQIARWAGQPSADELEGAKLEPPPPAQTRLALEPSKAPQIGASPPPQIGALPAPNQGAPPAPNRGAPRPKSGRPYLMISRPDLQTEIPADPPASASAQASAPAGGRAGGGLDLHFLGELAALLCPGLPAETAAGRMADLPGATTALLAAFLREAIPAARQRGARFPFGAALSTWEAWRGAQQARQAPAAPLLAPAPLTPPRRPGEARPVAALANPEDFLARVRAARQSLQRVAPPAQPTSPGADLEKKP